MRRTVLTDPYFTIQPELTFIDALKKPLHEAAPDYYGQRAIAPGEVDVHGLYIKKAFENDPEQLLNTIYEDFDLFLKVYGIGGSQFPIYLEIGETACFEAYTIEVTEEKIVITAKDTEGIRRALVYLEDELRRAENAYLMPGITRKKPSVRSRITRCFFSPINRPPKYGDELSDDIDYYPEAYLNRLMHEGSNGVWIYTRFSDILPSEIIPEYGIGYEKRMAKLNRVIEKCRRYGIGVYVFAIEPVALTPELAKKHPEIVGGDVGYNGNPLFCCESEKGKAYCYEAGKKLCELYPKLRGFISITYGERPTSCASVISGKEEFDEPMVHSTCPRCKSKKPGEILANALEALRSGAREVNPEFETVSWTYGHRQWGLDDIRDYVDVAPSDVILMQNFEDAGFEAQLGKQRISTDYWLSYPGPSEMFAETAKRALEKNKTIYAKMQVCCSHEIATVPYVPVPGIVFDKYKGAAECGVRGVMQCWYFGNYPSLMSKAANEASFLENFENKDAFLEHIAGIYFGKTRAKAVAAAWKLFESGYRNYPLNIMFSYYGPMHDSVVWQLSLLPKNFAPARTWQLVDPMDGDRICDALCSAHTLKEARILCARMAQDWSAGVKLLADMESAHAEEAEQLAVARAIGLLFEGGNRILEFYQLRDDLGRGIGDAEVILARMREIVEAEIENSAAMLPLCNACASLGYHSEAEGFKFFPEKLENRIEQLKALLKTEFPIVEARLSEGKSALAYYDGEEAYPGLKRYRMPQGKLEAAPWEAIGESGKHKFRMAYEGEKLYLELLSTDENAQILVCPEYRLFTAEPQLRFNKNGFMHLNYNDYLYWQITHERKKEILEKYRNMEVLCDAGMHLKFELDIDELGLDKIRPMKMKFEVNDSEMWCVSDREVRADLMPPSTLGKNKVVIEEYGWILPEA